jgi:hypothetical protein
VTGRKRSEEKFLRIVACRVAAKGRVRTPGNKRFPVNGNLMRPFIGTVGFGAFTCIALPD